MRLTAFVCAWWLALAGWWVLLVGTNAGLEEIAAACAAVLATLFALGLRRVGLLGFRFEAVWLAKTLKTPWNVVQELGVLVRVLALHLARARTVAGAYRAIPFPTGGVDAVSAGRRAVAELADALSPNTLPLDADLERDVVLRHELDPRRAGDELP